MRDERDLSPSPCSVIVLLLCYRLPALLLSPSSVIVLLLCYRLPALLSSPCSVIVLLLCYRFPALLSSSCSVIVSLLCYRPPALLPPPCSVNVPLLCCPFLAVRLICRRSLALSSTSSVSFLLSCRRPITLSSSSYSIVLQLLCHRPCHGRSRKKSRITGLGACTSDSVHSPSHAPYVDDSCTSQAPVEAI